MTTSDVHYHNESGEYWYKKYAKCNRENEQLKKELEDLQVKFRKFNNQMIGDVE